ncbi:MAG: hypothetical protein A2049_01905 [Elusimicrobia bacterium GWA2_62_23]|nr:MAG: hypothetical protein A2049_01905 [Elusimicrobia bacterium GWA2_62_23]
MKRALLTAILCVLAGLAGPRGSAAESGIVFDPSKGAMTGQLDMGNYAIYSSSAITAARYQINGSTVLAILPGNGSLGVGPNAGEVSVGQQNLFVGAESGFSNATGVGNTFLGYQAGFYELGSNKLYIANSGTISPLIFGDFSAKTVGISTGTPQAALDVVSTGTASNVYAQIWRDSTGLIVSSMTATGVLYPQSAPVGDNLGNHTATQALDLAGFTATNVSTITMQNGSIAIVQPGGTGSNTLYGISMGYGAANNYGNGIGIGRDATNNYSTGVGVGYGAHDNHDYGIGIGYLAYNNYSYGIGIGRQSLGNYNYGVGVGWAAGQNRDYGVGVGYGASGNNSSGVGVGPSAYDNNNSGVGVGSNANNNLNSGVGVGPSANQNYDSGVGVGSGARNNYTGGVGVGNDANQNSIYGVGIGASALSNSNRGVGIGAYAQGNSSYGVGIGAYSQNNGSYGIGVGAYTSSKSSAVALGYYARANSVDSVALGAGATTNAVRSVCIGAYCVNNAVDTAKIREGYTLKVDSISISAALAQLTVSTNVYIVGYSSAAKYYGDGSGLTGISGADNTKVAKTGDTMTGQLTLAGSTLTVTGNAFSVGGSTFAVSAGKVGVGTSSPDAKFEVKQNTADANTYALKVSSNNGAAMLVVSSQGSVGIGLDSPDTALELAGAVASNFGGIKHYRSLAYYNGGGTLTGTLKITMPKLWSSTMLLLRIEGYNYDSAPGHWEVLVSGYNYGPSGPWYAYSAEIRGKAPFSQVRLASDGTKNVLLLGHTGTNWYYPKVAVSELVAGAGQAGRDGWGSGWGISLISSEAGIVDVVSPAPGLRTVGSFLVSGSTNPALAGTVDRGMIVTPGGRVGIAAASPAAALDVVAEGAAAGDYAQIWRNSAGTIVSSMTATGVLYPAISGADNTKVAKTGDTMTGQLTLAGSTLTVTGSAFSVGGSTLVVRDGKVGIGNPNPDYELDFSLAGADGDTRRIRFGSVNSPIAGGGIVFAPNYSGYTKRSAGILHAGQDSYFRGGLAFYTNNAADQTTDWSERMRLSMNGELGIGANAPGARLEVKQAVSDAYAVKISSNDGAGMLWVSNKGLMGIGNSAPAYELDFAYPGGTADTKSLRFGALNSAGTGGGVVWAPNYTGYTKRTAGILNVGEDTYFRGGLAFYTNNIADQTTDWSERMRIDMAGKVGIGTGGPGSYRLHVSSGAGESGTVMAVSTGSTNLFWVAGDGAHAVKFFGDGSGLTGVPGDNLGNHTATQTLNMAAFPVINVSSIALLGDGLRISTSVYAGASGVFISAAGAIYTLGLGNGTAYPDPRGAGAVDLQVARASTDQVASGVASAIAGGERNKATGYASTVAGGYLNRVLDDYSAIGGGRNNAVIYGPSVVAGGEDNTAAESYSTVSGGFQNTASGYDTVVAGGAANTASGDYSAVSGGELNRAAGGRSFVAGGSSNNAGGDYSFAAGRASSSTASGAFTWADSQGSPYYALNTTPDRTLFKNRGGFLVTGSTNTAMTGTADRGMFISGNGLVGISTGTPYAALDVVSTGTAVNQMAQLWRASDGVIVGSMSAIGTLMAARFVGDGSGLTGISGGSAGPSIDVSTINAAATTPYGGVSITTNVFVTGGARLAKAVVQAADSGLTLTADDFGKTITVNSASAQTVYLPSISAADIGATVRIIKLGAGTVTIDAADSDTIADSGAGDTIYNNSATPPYASLELLLATDTKWAVVAGDGAWITTD